jgi:hypothetical protein
MDDDDRHFLRAVPRPAAGTSAAFFFDPLCPWTWVTSRWLVDVANRRGFAVVWRALSLSMLRSDDGGSSEATATGPVAVGLGFLRMTEYLASRHEFEATGRLYRAWGARVHDGGASPIAPVLEDAAREAGLSRRVRHAAGDPELDRAVWRATDTASAYAGPDVGSPVLVPPGATRGVFGPIMTSPPRGDDALELWDAVATFTAIDSVYELKHGRSQRRPDRPVPKSA